MCIAVFMWEANPLYTLLLFLNRDEYHNRPTKPLEWWEGRDVLAGQDEVAGCTWLACSRRGRVAFITNVLESHSFPEAKTRGDLPILFLESKKSPKEFAEELAKEANHYNGFNLIIADMPTKSMVYVTNQPKGKPVSIQDVSPGIHVLSNARLDTPWPKAKRLANNFKLQLGIYGRADIPVREMVEELMRDTEKAGVDELPQICSLDWEYNLSSIFVQVETPLGRYGTRSTAAVSVKADGETTSYETYIEGDDDNIWKEHSFNFQVLK